MDYVYGKTLKLLIYALFKLYGSGSVEAEGVKKSQSPGSSPFIALFP